jgi:hypothetical protein
LLGPRLAQPPGLSPNPGGARWPPPRPPRSSQPRRYSPIPSGWHSPDTWPDTAASPGRPTSWTCASTQAGATSTTCACSVPAALTSSASPATWKPAPAPEPPSPGGCAPSRGFYRYAVEEELLDHSPAAHVRRPRLDYESHATALDRNELGALLVAAGLGPPAEHALISLLALNGLRVSEATDIEALGIEREHRSPAPKGGKKGTAGRPALAAARARVTSRLA